MAKKRASGRKVTATRARVIDPEKMLPLDNLNVTKHIFEAPESH